MKGWLIHPKMWPRIKTLRICLFVGRFNLKYRLNPHCDWIQWLSDALINICHCDQCIFEVVSNADWRDNLRGVVNLYLVIHILFALRYCQGTGIISSDQWRSCRERTVCKEEVWRYLGVGEFGMCRLLNVMEKTGSGELVTNVEATFLSTSTKVRLVWPLEQEIVTLIPNKFRRKKSVDIYDKAPKQKGFVSLCSYCTIT